MSIAVLCVLSEYSGSDFLLIIILRTVIHDHRSRLLIKHLQIVKYYPVKVNSICRHI